MKNGEFLTKRELAKMLKLSTYTIESWVHEQRELPFFRMGKSVRFAVKDVEAWIEKNKVNPGQPKKEK